MSDRLWALWQQQLRVQPRAAAISHRASGTPAHEFSRAWLLGRTTTPIDKAAAVLGDVAWQALRATLEEGDRR